jgi:DNA repair protein RecO (recombination protein O)
MNDERARGVILRVRPLTDTSLVVHWLTAEQGRIATVAKGARAAGSAFAGKLDLFFLAEFSFARSRRSELHILREVVVLDHHAGLRADYGRLAQASYAVSLVEHFTEAETAVPETFALFLELLAYLTGQSAQARSLFAFELRLLASQGLQPDFNATGLAPDAQDLARALLTESWARLPALTANPDAIRAVRQFLHGFIIYHGGRLPRGRAEALGSRGPKPGAPKPKYSV